MVEYDLAASGNGILEIASLDRVEQTAVPLTAIVWPVPDNLSEECRKDVPTILIANDEVTLCFFGGIFRELYVYFCSSADFLKLDSNRSEYV